MPLLSKIFILLFYTAIISITILAFLPDYDALPPIVSFSDLLNHTIAFITLFILLRLAHPALATNYAIGVLLIYAFWIELVQYFLPTRFASWSDIGADSVGLVLGFLIVKLFQKKA